MSARQTIMAVARHELFIPALFGVALRLVLMPFFIWPHDIVAQELSLTSLLNHYDPYSMSVSMYPPFIYMLLSPFLLIASRVGLAFGFYVFPVTFDASMYTELITSIFGDPAFLVFWKFPLLIFDLLTGWLIYGLTKELTMDISKAKKAFILWFFNPFVLITSYFHGAFDVIAVFFILLGVYFLSKNKLLLSGISFGFGGITKVSPFLIALPLSALVFFEKIDGLQGIFSRKRLSNAVTFLTGCMIPILISVIWNLNYYNLLIASTLSELSINGGLNQWFFAANSTIRFSLFTPNLNILTRILYFYPLISLIPLLSMHKILWNSRIKSYIVLLLSTFSLVIVYFVSPATVQPQYILWLIPGLTIVSMKNRRFYWSLAILSFAASAFFFSVQSPFAFVYPLALFPQLVNVNQLNSVIVGYSRASGVFCAFLREDLCFLFGAIGFIGLVLTIIFITVELKKAAKDAQD